MVKLEEEIVSQWNLKLLKRLSINAMNSALNLPLLRQVIKERVSESSQPVFLKPLTQRVLVHSANTSFTEKTRNYDSNSTYSFQPQHSHVVFTQESGVSQQQQPSSPEPKEQKIEIDIKGRHSVDFSISQDSFFPYKLSPPSRNVRIVGSKSTKAAVKHEFKISRIVDTLRSEEFMKRESFNFGNRRDIAQFREHMTEREELRFMTQDLYPFSKHSSVFIVPANMKLEFQLKHYIKTHMQKSQDIETRCKFQVLQKLKRKCKQGFMHQIQEYDRLLYKFIESHQKEISHQRSRLLLLGKGHKLKKMSYFQRSKYLASFIKEAPKAPDFQVTISAKDFETSLSDFHKQFSESVRKYEKLG